MPLTNDIQNLYPFYASKNRFYIGSTGDDLVQRIKRHNTNYKKLAFIYLFTLIFKNHHLHLYLLKIQSRSKLIRAFHSKGLPHFFAVSIYSFLFAQLLTYTLLPFQD